MNELLIQPAKLESIPDGSSQIHPPWNPSTIEEDNSNKLKSGSFDPRTTLRPDPAISWTQSEYINKTLEIETASHNETRSALSIFRTKCFKLEQLLAQQKEESLSDKETIQTLRAKSQEDIVRRMEAEAQIKELQQLNEALMASYIGTGSGLGHNGRHGTPFSDYRSATFSPSLQSPKNFNNVKRDLSPNAMRPDSKRLRLSSESLKLNSPQTPTAMVAGIDV
ncbi:hypothetical protein F5884DRAFT_758943 [Xylogone sp. PMI_703]|nr:hypothetical protein F5884DRAFT_758943 [Xylogone sp. PMI_703]